MPQHIETKKIEDLLITLNDTEFEYVRLCLDTAQNIRDLFKRFKISEDEFCKRINIKPEKLKDYRNGAHDFSLTFHAKLSGLWFELISAENLEKATKEARTIKIGDE